MHPLGVILAIACGVLVAGVAGALVAVPVAAAANAVVLHLAEPGRDAGGGSRTAGLPGGDRRLGSGTSAGVGLGVQDGHRLGLAVDLVGDGLALAAAVDGLA
ncbi:hypothetical protein [Nocardioides convexus]|uniref:hypothetical protein n=1 Tax=Nocardioides convexus TaxID=2712224 RepID=UPI0024184582|nr:hypothetical protein [Nocardioides convexus]